MKNKQSLANKVGKIYKIRGMDCDACAKMIELDLEDAGHSCRCSYIDKTLEVHNDHDVKKIAEIIKKSGYTLEEI